MRKLKEGDTVRIKRPRSWSLRSECNYGKVISKDNYFSVKILTDWGEGECELTDIVKCKKQLPSDWKPLRHKLPYGMWTCEDGREVLFNRDYQPIWSRNINHQPIANDPEEWIKWKGQKWFYNDSTTPWRDKKSYEVCENILKEWGVA
jgi:hypothetical protein